jgi:hypothetical protein
MVLRVPLVVTALGFLVAANAAPLPAEYETVLGPTPINNATKLVLSGDGAVVAILSGNTLKVTGTFEGLSSPAMDAHIMMGEGIGIPGNPILDLVATREPSGTISGSFTLNRSQAEALKNGHLYVQVNSQKGPAPGGNLWGWLLPKHIKADQDEPQMGSWFLPQGAGLKASHGGRNS